MNKVTSVFNDNVRSWFTLNIRGNPEVYAPWKKDDNAKPTVFETRECAIRLALEKMTPHTSVVRYDPICAIH